MVTLYRAISILFDIIEFLILVRIIFSFLRIGPYNPVGRFIFEMTEPILGPIRELIYKLGIDTGMFDFSPLIAVLLFQIILSFLRAILI
ncbi:MAG: YggT family protein [Tissierellia bacterium]|nr:YggT family protein [Tissierellia bacterium]